MPTAFENKVQAEIERRAAQIRLKQEHAELVEALGNAMPLLILAGHEAKKLCDHEFMDRLRDSVVESRALLEKVK